MRTARDYASLIKLSHSVFALPFALLSLLVAARGDLSARRLLLCVAAVFLARTSAMAYNRWLDRAIDAENPRTKGVRFRAARSRRAMRCCWRLAAAGHFFGAAPCCHQPTVTWACPCSPFAGLQPHETLHGVVSPVAWCSTRHRTSCCVGCGAGQFGFARHANVARPRSRMLGCGF